MHSLLKFSEFLATGGSAHDTTHVISCSSWSTNRRLRCKMQHSFPALVAGITDGKLSAKARSVVHNLHLGKTTMEATVACSRGLHVADRTEYITTATHMTGTNLVFVTSYASHDLVALSNSLSSWSSLHCY